MNIRKGDQVIVLSGKDKGKKEKVLSVLDAKKLIRVENVMIVKKHTKPNRKFQGGIIEMPSLISSSKVMLVCPLCEKPTRISMTIDTNKNKVRTCKKCEQVIDKG